MMWSKKTAEVGDRKTQTCFAWFPVELDEPEHIVVWLRFYKRDLEYSTYGWDNKPYAWIICKNYLYKDN
jgi:hypothetical protein